MLIYMLCTIGQAIAKSFRGPIVYALQLFSMSRREAIVRAVHFALTETGIIILLFALVLTYYLAAIDVEAAMHATGTFHIKFHINYTLTY